MATTRHNVYSRINETGVYIAGLLGQLDAAIDHGAPLTLATVRERLENILASNTAARVVAINLPAGEAR